MPNGQGQLPPSGNGAQFSRGWMDLEGVSEDEDGLPEKEDEGSEMCSLGRVDHVLGRN